MSNNKMFSGEKIFKERDNSLFSDEKDIEIENNQYDNLNTTQTNFNNDNNKETSDELENEHFTHKSKNSKVGDSYNDLNKQDQIDINTLDKSTYEDDNLKPIPIKSTEEVANKSKSFRFLEKCYSYTLKFLICLVIVSMNVFYILALEFKRCKKSAYACRIEYEVIDFLTVVYFLLASSLLFTAFMLTCYINKHYKLMKFVAFNYILLFIYDYGYSLQSRGGYVRNYFFVFSIFFLFIEIIFYFMIKFLKAHSYIGTLLYSSLAYLIYISSLHYIFEYSCKDFKKGLNNTEIDNHSNLNCITPVPEYCSFHIFDGILDLPRWLNLDCATERADIGLLIKYSDTLRVSGNFSFLGVDINDLDAVNYYLSARIRKIGFPRTELMDRNLDIPTGEVQKYILNRIFDYNGASKEVKDRTEYWLQYNISTNEYDPIIDVKFDKNLSETQNKLLNFTYSNIIKNNNINVSESEVVDGKIDKNKLQKSPLVKNVITMFFDATSRRHFFRKFKRLMGFLEKHYNNPNSNLSSYQFMKHQSIYPGTLANIGAAYFGTYNKGNGYSLTKKFQDFGYVTGGVNNQCSAEFIDIKRKDPVKWNFQAEHHELVAPFCDPNLMSSKGAYTDFKGQYSVLKKCLHRMQSVDYSLEYMRQFFEKYKDNHKLFKFGTADSHETSAEVIKYLDEPVTKFLEDLESNGTLNETAVIIFSDHGTYSHGWIYRYFETADYKIELSLPGLFILLPKSIKNFDIVDKNLRSRENSFTTAFDIYRTLISIPDGSEKKESFKKFGRSLFYNHLDDMNGEDSCNHLGTRATVCRCLKMSNVTKY